MWKICIFSGWNLMWLQHLQHIHAFNWYFGMFYLYYVICQDMLYSSTHCLWLFNSWQIWIIVCWCYNLYPGFQLEACAHPFFDDLRDPNACLLNERALPPLFNFTAQGKLLLSAFPLCIAWGSFLLLILKPPAELAGAPIELRHRLIPEHARSWILLDVVVTSAGNINGFLDS